MKSIWENSIENLNLQSLKENEKVDVCIVGAGLTGLNTAYFLTQSGYKVAIIEKGEIGNNTSGKTTAKITSQHGLKYATMIKKRGEEVAKKYFESQEDAIKAYKKIISKEKINCDLEERSAFIYTDDEKDKEKLMDELKAYTAFKANVKFHNDLQVPFKPKYALELKNQAQFNPIKYLNGIAKVIINKNAKIYTNSKVKDITRNGDKYLVHTESNYIEATHVVLATNYPITKIKGAHFTKLYQETSYGIGVEVNSDDINGMYINCKDPCYSFRTYKDSDGQMILMVIGFSHKTGKNIYLDNNYNELIAKAHSMYKDANVRYQWSTEDSVSIDSVPYVGSLCILDKNILIATGYSKWGMTNSMVAAKIIQEKITNSNKEKEKEKVFKVMRYRYLNNKKEVIQMTKDSIKYLFLEKINIKDSDISKLKKGEGKTFKIKDKIVGVYKDESGKIYMVNPICTHLKCLLNFNNLEKTWDCPCHGSRYNYDGKLIYGPGIDDLEIIKIK